MVFPISDDNSDRRIAPIVNYVLIGLNVFVFVVFQGFASRSAAGRGANERRMIAARLGHQLKHFLTLPSTHRI